MLIGHFPGWADGFAALEVSVTVFSGPSFRVLGRAATRNVIWNGHHNYGAERLTFDAEVRIAGPLMIPVSRGDMLRIDATAVQFAASWGLWSAAASNFEFRVGPIVHDV